jgi:hypothetical protein
MLALYPLIGLPAAIAVYVHAGRTGDRTFRVAALCFALLFVAILILRLAYPA